MKQKGAKGNLVTAKPVHWVYVTIVLLLIGPFSIALIYSGELYNGYVRTYVAPRIQRQFGFRMERRRMFYRTQALDVFVIESLNPDGVLARAGVRNGDVPVGAYHMSDVAFYRKLEESRKAAVEVYLVNWAEYEVSLKAGGLDLYEREHKVTVPRGE